METTLLGAPLISFRFGTKEAELGTPDVSFFVLLIGLDSFELGLVESSFDVELDSCEIRARSLNKLLWTGLLDVETFLDTIKSLELLELLVLIFALLEESFVNFMVLSSKKQNKHLF